MKFSIYQSKNPTFRVDESIEEYSKEDYNKVYSSELSAGELDEISILEGIFARYQGPKPEGYTGHSVSVGDIITLEDINQSWICDSFGWKEVKLG